MEGGCRRIGNAIGSTSYVRHGTFRRSDSPLRALNENQYKVRKQTEIVVDKSAKTLSDWRTAEAKSKKHSHTCARENEKVQDHFPDGKLPKPIQPEKENTKLEGKKKKAEDAAKKADIEYYTLCVRAERARLEWESEILKGSDMFQILEEERLKNLKTVLCSYLQHVNELGPRLLEASERLSRPVTQADPGNDLAIFISYRNSLQQNYEQLLPDFYCEHITLAMNKERRKQALEKLLQLFKQDIERENKSKNGLKKLTQAITQTPNFGNDDSQQNVSEKIYHMESMLMYLEGAKYKVQNALTELDGKPKIDHPLASYIIVMRDKSGLQQSILKVPQWLKDQMIKPENTSENKIPVDRTKADGSSDESDSGSGKLNYF
ncbi:hypothetical protein FQR65_LT05997 [Abscondita terminalis]|nr:hypothetical protein FQR65_LT05997 [Abscondita terminalis]